MNPLFIPVIANLATKVLDRLIASPETTVTRADSTAVRQEVAEAIAPTIEHLTNNEPWYQSRVTWGALIGAGTGIAALAGVTFDAYDQEMLVNIAIGLGALISSAVTLYGRWKAKKPLGA